MPYTIGKSKDCIAILKWKHAGEFMLHVLKVQMVGRCLTEVMRLIIFLLKNAL